MKNSWLKFLIPKEYLKIENLSQLSELRSNKVPIYSVKKIEDGYLVSTRKGASKDIDVMYNYSIYQGVLAFIIPTSMIWLGLLLAVNVLTIDYEIRGNLPCERLASVENVLENHFVSVGNFSFLRSSHDRVENDIQQLFHDYLWMDIKTEGNLLVISIFDTQVSVDDNIEDKTDTIYATSTGTITSIDVSTCRVLVEIGQVVRIGTPLVTCYTPTGFGEELAPIEGVAHGRIYAHVWYEMELSFDREFVVNLLTSKNETQWLLNIGDSQFNLWGSTPTFENYDERRETINPLSLFGISPLTFERVQSFEKRDIIMKNEIEQIQDAAHDIALAQLKNLLEDEFTLINLDLLQVDESDNKVSLTYHVTVEQNIAK